MSKAGRPRRWKTVAEMAADWEAYKDWCDHRTVLKTQFNSREGHFVTEEVPASVTYEINGFCVWSKITKQAFYEYYADNPKYVDFVKRMQNECEADVRNKLETGVIPTQLAGLWMGRHGYSLKQEEKVKVTTDDDTTALMDEFFKQKGQQ